MENIMNTYGKELIIDLHNCNTERFNRKDLRKYFKRLCEIIDMKAEKLVFWDDIGVEENERQFSPHTKGTSAVQFILTSNITVHTLDILGNIYVNIFSCKDFNVGDAEEFTIKYFEGEIKQSLTINRI